MNPVLDRTKYPHGAIDFSQIKTSDFIPALNKGIEEANKILDEIRNEKNPNFENIIVKLETSTEVIDNVQNIFYAYYGAMMTDEIQKLSAEFAQVITNFSNDITLDSKIFANIKICYEKDGLQGEDKKLLVKTYKDFVRSGALLSESDKVKYRKLDEELSQLALKFSENSLKSKNEFSYLAKFEELDGLSDMTKEMLAEAAKAKGKEGYLITLDYPCIIPILKNGKNRELREKISRANLSVANFGETSNKEVIKSLIDLKIQRANLLGYKTHAEFVLEERMAQSPDQVYKLNDDLYEVAFKRAKVEFAEVEKLAKSDGIKEFMPWDYNYYCEQYTKKELNFDEEKLKPYFKLENVIDGVFNVASKLYDLEFKSIDIPTYHEDVKTFEVTRSGNFIGLFYCDFHPRETKQSGAWMTDFYKQGLTKDGVKRPHVAIVCNFNKPVGDKPSLLTFDEVTTLFHEFGHALHGLLANTKYRSLSGTSVYWDFVELPSQIFENWCYEKECLDLFAKHYETNETIPQEYIDKIRENQTFLEASATLRQLKFGYLDMAYHTLEKMEIDDINAFERKAFEKFDLYETPDLGNFSCAFGHIFGGGYSAGYYSYKWAEILDADAFEAFKEKGIFNKEVANAFRKYILEKGGSEHPMELYKKFRGREPKVDALLNRAGLN